MSSLSKIEHPRGDACACEACAHGHCPLEDLAKLDQTAMRGGKLVGVALLGFVLPLLAAIGAGVASGSTAGALFGLGAGLVVAAVLGGVFAKRSSKGSVHV